MLKSVRLVVWLLAVSSPGLESASSVPLLSLSSPLVLFPSWVLLVRRDAIGLVSVSSEPSVLENTTMKALMFGLKPRSSGASV